MAANTRFVNLDAMIPRADFALQDDEGLSYGKESTIGLKDLKDDGLVSILRKPDFQRETNHWSPEQIVTLLECFLNGDLIPSVIMWKSSVFLFVIDGGHRLSVLRSWVLDDYGDGPLSNAFFGNSTAREQEKAAARTRALVAQRVGTYQHLLARESTNGLDQKARQKATMLIRGLPVLWVEGNAEKAEASFFKINMQGTPLDDLEELLLSCRKKPVAIGARAIIRAGMGHKYWSKFSEPIGREIEALAKQIHRTLFRPEVETPIKTLDLPLGGSSGVRAALQVLLEFILAAIRDQSGEPKTLKTQDDDPDGSATKDVLTSTLYLASRITGNDHGSLGLHPAIYFYGPTGRHQTQMFLGIALLISKKLINNDKRFFEQFTSVRVRLEHTLIFQKDLIATALQKTISKHRAETYANLIDGLVRRCVNDHSYDATDEDIVAFTGLSGKIVTGPERTHGAEFSDDTKSAAFIKGAIKSALKCPVCNGYLDPSKSVSYDHKQEKSAGGLGGEANLQLTHPYCNQATKNQVVQTAAAGQIPESAKTS